MRLAFALLLAAFCGCMQHTRTMPPAPRVVVTPPPRVAPTSPPVRVRIEHVAATRMWNIRYAFETPVAAVRFKRGHYPHRGSDWKIVTRGVRLESTEEGDVLRADAPLTAIEVEIHSFVRAAEKDYDLFFLYKDGSELLYTGAFDVKPVEDAYAYAKTDNVFTFLPDASERVVVLGKVASGPTTWTAAKTGTYVYFGKTDPVVTDDMVAVVDSGVPAWLRERTATFLPKLFAFYRERTGVPLDFKPVVFLDYGDETAPKSRSMGGNTLDGLMQLEVRLGSFYKTPAAEPGVTEQVGYLLAHEAAHFWNGEMFHHETEGGEWMHEGGADAFAFRAMEHFGVVTPARYREILSESLSQCQVGVAGRALRASGATGLFKNFYHCGSTLALVTELATHTDIFAFWGTMLRAAPQRVYGDALYYETLHANDAAAMIRDFVEKPVDVRVLDRSLTALGVRLRESDRQATNEYRQRAALIAGRHVIQRDCGDAVAMECSSMSGCRVDGASSCHALPATFRFAQLGPHATSTTGAAGYDYVQARCAASAMLDVTVRDEKAARHVACDAPLSPRPPYLTIDRLP